LASAAKSPSASLRSVWFCVSISLGLRTFCALVAKCPCQNQVIRSTKGAPVLTIRSSHHSVKVF
jgi:hypothetical protein